MQVQEVIVLGKSEEFEKHWREEMENVYKLIKMELLNLEYRNQRRYEFTQKRWNRLIFILAVSYLPLILACYKLSLMLNQFLQSSSNRYSSS